MHSRMIKFLDEHKILFKHQFGFQKHKSTTLAILDLYTKLVENIEGKRFSCCIFLDFSKALDTVNHNIPLEKMEHYGIRGIAQSWFKSYLTDRQQTVSVNGETARNRFINCGVAQGSVLGPLLFLLYINDIHVSSKKLDFHLFADDTLLFSSKNLQNLEQTVNLELTNISDWLLANKLSLNVSKSNFLIINPHQRKIDKPIALQIDNEKLEQKDYAKYLGVLVDKRLSWKQHIKQLNIKISKSIGLLYKTRHLVPLETLCTLYNSFIQSHMLYGILNWGSAYNTNLEPLKCNLRKAIRVIDFAKYQAHSKPLFKKYSLLNFDSMYKLEVAKFMFDIYHENGEIFNDLFIKTKQGNL